MKKFLILVLSVLLTALSLVSCQEYDDGDISRVDSLAGIEGTDSLQPAAGTNEKSAEGENLPEESSPGTPQPVLEDNPIGYTAYNLRTIECNVDYPSILLINSKEELEEYIDTACLWNNEETGIINFLNTRKSFMEAVCRYDEEYFKNNILAFVHIEAISGSIDYWFDSLEDSGKIHINYTSPELQTCDMEYWHIIIEVPKDHPAVVVNTFTLEFEYVPEDDCVQPIDPNENSLPEGDDDYTAYVIRTSMCQVEYPSVLTLYTKEELDEYLATNFIIGDYYEAEFLEKITKYDKEYFENNLLVLVRLEAISGSIKFKFAGLDDTGKMHVQEIWPAYEMTDDMAYWHIIIEVPHSHPAIPADVDFTIELTRISEE